MDSGTDVTINTGNIYITDTTQMVAESPDIVTPTLGNSWANYSASGGYQQARYIRQQQIVTIQGLIKSGTLSTTIFTLNAGYRPVTKHLIYRINTNTGLGELRVYTSGAVQIVQGGNGWADINVTFPAG